MPTGFATTNKRPQVGINTKTKGRRSVIGGKNKAWKEHLAQGSKNVAADARYEQKTEYERELEAQKRKVDAERKKQYQLQAAQMQQELGMANEDESDETPQKPQRLSEAEYQHMRRQRHFMKRIFANNTTCINYYSDTLEEDVVIFKHRAAMNAYYHRVVGDDEWAGNEEMLGELQARYCPLEAPPLTGEECALRRSRGGTLSSDDGDNSSGAAAAFSVPVKGADSSSETEPDTGDFHSAAQGDAVAAVSSAEADVACPDSVFSSLVGGMERGNIH